jgi:hypothetical protein
MNHQVPLVQWLCSTGCGCTCGFLPFVVCQVAAFLLQVMVAVQAEQQFDCLARDDGLQAKAHSFWFFGMIDKQSGLKTNSAPRLSVTFWQRVQERWMADLPGQWDSVRILAIPRFI